MEKYDALLVLGHELTKEKELTETSRERIDVGIGLIKNGFANKLIVSGGHEDFGECYGISVARAMKNYAIKKGILKENILEEDISLDTVGELIFCKIGIIVPRNWKKNLIITHNYHMQRTKRESEFIFGKNYNLDFKGVKNSDIPLRSEEQEKRSYQSFCETFNWIKPGDDNRILERLLKKHPLYCERREYTLTKLEILRRKNS